MFTSLYYLTLPKYTYVALLKITYFLKLSANSEEMISHTLSGSSDDVTDIDCKSYQKPLPNLLPCNG